MRREEDQIQAAVVLHLTTRAAPGVSWFAVPNGGYRRAAEARIMRSLGTRAGVPDIIVIRDGRAFGLELKRVKGGRLSPAQRDMQEELAGAGMTIATAHGLDAALAVLEEWGAIRTCRQTGGDHRAAISAATPCR